MNNLERTPQTPPQIEPLLHQENRPFISVMIPTFNCIHYLENTLNSVLSQDFDLGMLQIEVIDDHSTDGDVEALVKRVGGGKVRFFQQARNVGSLRNFETCINRAKGEWVHILHGDDQVLQGFYQEITSLIKGFPQASAVFTDYWYMDNSGKYLHHLPPLLPQQGILPNWLETIAQGQRIQPPAILVKRAVYEDLGSFFGVHYGEDWEMWVRIASKYEFAYSPNYLAMYRIHTTNITSRSFLSSQDIKDIIKVIDLIQPYLPLEKRAMYKRNALKNYAQYFAKVSNKIYHDYKNPKAARHHAFRSFMMHQNTETLKYLVKILIKGLVRYKVK